MNAKSQISGNQAAETGTQLFSRLLASNTNKNSQKDQTFENTQLSRINTQIESSLKLNRHIQIAEQIFPGGLDNKTIVEITGSSNSGKTELLYVLISRLLFPKKWKIPFQKSDLVVDLIDFSAAYLHEELDKMQKVILIETDSKFNLLRLFTVMENRVSAAYCKQIGTSLPSPIKILLGKFVKECLKNFVVYKCNSSEQLVLSLAACEYFIQNQLTNKNEIVPIFIDSINVNYEVIDKFTKKIGLSEINNAENYTMTLIRKIVERYNIIIIATFTEWSPQVYSSNNSENIKTYVNKSYEKWHQSVGRKIELYRVQMKNFLRHSQLVLKENSQNIGTNILLQDVGFTIENSGFEIE